MARTLKVLTLLTLAATMSLPGLASAQDYRRADEARHDRKANEGFSTSRTTAGSDQSGQVRYSMANNEGRPRIYSTEQADRELSQGHDAYAAGNYRSACRSFRFAKDLYKRAGDVDRTSSAAALAADACATARYNSSSPGRSMRTN